MVTDGIRVMKPTSTEESGSRSTGVRDWGIDLIPQLDRNSDVFFPQMSTKTAVPSPNSELFFLHSVKDSTYRVHVDMVLCVMRIESETSLKFDNMDM
jgi:hypothetical protein